MYKINHHSIRMSPDELTIALTLDASLYYYIACMLYLASIGYISMYSGLGINLKVEPLIVDTPLAGMPYIRPLYKGQYSRYRN